MKPIISVESLSKSYTICHEHMGRYKSLREELFKIHKRLLKQESRNNKEKFWALKDVSFDIKPGDRVGIIGRNGAGKSTLLKLLSRITEPTLGRITLRGRVASLLEVGTGFHSELTGAENIYLNGAILGMSRIEVRQKFDEIVSFAGVEKFLDTPVKRYSSGMYVRLAFSIAAHLDPEILIVDEVLAVGDAEFQKKSLGKMEDVSNKSGRTVLFVSHNIGVIESLCNYGVFIDRGAIQECGDIRRVIDAYEKQCVCLASNNEGNFFKNISLKKNGVISSFFSLGDDIDLEFTFLMPETIFHPNIVFYVTNAAGSLLFGSSTDIESIKYPFSPLRYYKIFLKFKNIFAHGTYYVRMILEDSCTKNIVEDIPFVTSFESKKSTPQVWSKVYYPVSIKVNEL